MLLSKSILCGWDAARGANHSPLKMLLCPFFFAGKAKDINLQNLRLLIECAVRSHHGSFENTFRKSQNVFFTFINFSPTHEECITSIVAQTQISAKELPLRYRRSKIKTEIRNNVSTKTNV